MRKAVPILIALALSACAGQPTHWVKDGATAQDFQKDDWTCQVQAAQLAHDTWGKDAAAYLMVTGGGKDDCLRANGWRKD